ncbi:MAG: aminodeoxychorismate synthase component I [Paraprevotella sp.]|nr:aminodeoxychorismate synthase component I [Paraprevotella sp.]
MQPYAKKEAIKRINRLAATGQPFIFIIDYEQKQTYVEKTDNVDDNLCRYDFNGKANTAKQNGHTNEEFTWQPEVPPLNEYLAAFNIVNKHIQTGNSYLTNLTWQVPVTTDLNMKTIFHRAQARYKLWLKDRFVCFSPEPFVHIRNGRIHSFPMKGTIDASLPDAEGQLIRNEKEAAEHATIVDLIRNDLSMVAEQVQVKRYRYCERLETNKGAILQTSSEICGTLPQDHIKRIGDILFRLLPAGSVTGAPKPRTCTIITEAERYQRGFYTGVMGWCDGQTLESAVMIRFIEQENGRLYYKAGGGITSRSHAEEEYHELIQKIYVPIYRDYQD